MITYLKILNSISLSQKESEINTQKSNHNIWKKFEIIEKEQYLLGISISKKNLK